MEFHHRFTIRMGSMLFRIRIYRVNSPSYISMTSQSHITTAASPLHVLSISIHPTGRTVLCSISECKVYTGID